MFFLERETLSIILISLNIGLPMAALVTVVATLAFVFRADASVTRAEATTDSAADFLRTRTIATNVATLVDAGQFSGVSEQPAEASAVLSIQ